MANKLGRGLAALFENEPTNKNNDEKLCNQNSDECIAPNGTVNETATANISETLIVPARNEEAIEIAQHIEESIHLPTSLQITKKGGKLIIKCKTYEELEILVKKLTADE